MTLHCALSFNLLPELQELMSGLKTVFWDVDGTLADTEMQGHRPAFNRAFVEQGLDWNWDSATYMRLLKIPGGLLRMKTYAEQRGELLSDDQLKVLRLSKQNHYLKEVRSGNVSLRPGVLRLLRELQTCSISQWIVTSSGSPSVSALLETIFPGDDHPFAGVLSADDVDRHKPHPEPYLQALQRSHTNPDAALVFEDSAPGLQSAVEAGLRCILMPSPWDKDLQRYQHHAVAAIDHLGNAHNPCTVISGPPCLDGYVTLEYLQKLLVLPKRCRHI